MAPQNATELAEGLAKSAYLDQALDAVNDSPPLPQLNAEQELLLDGYLERLLSANSKFNLTAIRDPADARERHIVECLRFVSVLDELLPRKTKEHAKLLDVGSGGGLPGMVLAIARPDLRVALLESINKKASFLSDTARDLRLSHVQVHCARAEVAAAPGEPLREQFDIVSARAVAALPTLLELTVPFVKTGGHLLLVKGERYQEELDAADKAMQVLGTACIQTIRHPTATVLVFKKTKATSPRFPRRSGEPKRKPL